jgi:hypothetical protein
VNIVLHSARDKDELDKALQPLIDRCLDEGLMNWLSHKNTKNCAVMDLMK